MYYNKNCKQYPEFHINDQIFFKKNPKDIIWTKGIIESKTKFPRSYIVRDYNGSTYRRNSQHIRLNYKSNKNLTESNKKVTFTSPSHGQKISQNPIKETETLNKNEKEEDNCIFIFTHQLSPESDSIISPTNETNNDSDSFLSVESNVLNISNDEIKSPLFVNVEDNDISNESIHDYNEYDNIDNQATLSEITLTSPNENIPDDIALISPLCDDLCNNDILPEKEYSSRGRLLKKTQKLDL